MKLKIISMIIATGLVAAAMCGCEDGQTGGGQTLNDRPDTRIIRENENGDEQTPENVQMPQPPELPPHGEHHDGKQPDSKQTDGKQPDGKTPPPRNTDGRRAPKHIFGDRKEKRQSEHPRCPDRNADEGNDEETPENMAAQPGN